MGQNYLQSSPLHGLTWVIDCTHMKVSNILVVVQFEDYYGLYLCFCSCTSLFLYEAKALSGMWPEVVYLDQFKNLDYCETSGKTILTILT